MSCSHAYATDGGVVVNGQKTSTIKRLSGPQGDAGGSRRCAPFRHFSAGALLIDAG
jgi:hypothetical protein